METKIIIKNTVILLAILLLVFLSQQPYFKPVGKNGYALATKQGNTYWQKTGNWIKINVWPKVSGGANSVKDSAVAQITTQKNNLVEKVWEQFKNYFTAKFLTTFGTKVK